MLGDFGLWNTSVPFLPNQYYESIVVDFDYAGDDTIEGGDDDGECTDSYGFSFWLGLVAHMQSQTCEIDFLMGQEGNDVISGGNNNDDILGGHNK